MTLLLLFDIISKESQSRYKEGEGMSRIFVVNVGSKLILGKGQPKLNIEKLICEKVCFYNDKDFVSLYVNPPYHGKFIHARIEKSAGTVKEFIAMPFSVKDEQDFGAKVRIPANRDRIIVEEAFDFEPCNAVKIVESD